MSDQAGRTTTDGRPPRPGLEQAAAPAPINPATGQHEAYWVLTEAERAKGWVRPYRDQYVHVAPKPEGQTRLLTREEAERFAGTGFVLFEQFLPTDPRWYEGAPEDTGPGRYWTQAELDRPACGVVTSMARDLSETYARDPSFYGATFCVGCRKHLPVAEFFWTRDGARVGS